MHQLSVGHGESAQVHLNVFKPLLGIGHFDICVIILTGRSACNWIRPMMKCKLSTSFSSKVKTIKCYLGPTHIYQPTISALLSQARLAQRKFFAANLLVNNCLWANKMTIVIMIGRLVSRDQIWLVEPLRWGRSRLDFTSSSTILASQTASTELSVCLIIFTLVLPGYLLPAYVEPKQKKHFNSEIWKCAIKTFTWFAEQIESRIILQDKLSSQPTVWRNFRLLPKLLKISCKCIATFSAFRATGPRR